MQVVCLKGSRYLGIYKDVVYQVEEVRDYDGFGRRELKLTLIIQGKRKTLYIPSVHKNKLKSVDGFNANDGNPLHKVKLAFQGDFTVSKDQPLKVSSPW